MNVAVSQFWTPTPHKFTLEEARRIWASGIFADFPDMELINGELVEMPSDGPRTIDWNERMNAWLVRSLPEGFRLVPDKTLDLAPYGGPRPDFYVHDRLSAAEVNGLNVLLVIEISDTTLEYDRTVKAKLYAEGGVREYWIADCAARRLLVHRLGPDGSYSEPTEVGFDEEAEALFVPGLSLRLSALGLPD